MYLVPLSFLYRQQEEYQRVDAAHSEAAALFEEELQALGAQLDQEFGRDSASKYVGVVFS